MRTTMLERSSSTDCCNCYPDTSQYLFLLCIFERPCQNLFTPCKVTTGYDTAQARSRVVGNPHGGAGQGDTGEQDNTTTNQYPLSLDGRGIKGEGDSKTVPPHRHSRVGGNPIVKRNSGEQPFARLTGCSTGFFKDIDLRDFIISQNHLCFLCQVGIAFLQYRYIIDNAQA